MEVIIAFREEHGRSLHHREELQADEEEEDSYYATAAVQEEDDEYFEATGSRQDHQKERGVTAAAEDFRGTVGQLNEFNNNFLENMKETFQRKSNEVRALTDWLGH